MKQAVYHFVILIAVLLIGLLSFVSLRGNPTSQLVVGIITSIAYVVWGILHHYASGDLYKRVVIEYCLVGCIAIYFLFLLLRG